MALTLVTAPSEWPVSIEEVRAWCGVEDSSQDIVLNLALGAACGMVEKFTGRALGQQVWRLTLDAFSDAIELARAPVLSLTENGFTYLDEAGDSQAVDPALWSLDLFSDPAWIVLNSDGSWPTIQDTVNAVQVQFNTGYTAELLPDDIKMAVLMLTAQWFENRGGANVGNIVSTMPNGVSSLLMPYRRILI